MLPGYMRLKEAFGDMERKIEKMEDDMDKMGRAVVEVNENFRKAYTSQFQRLSALDTRTLRFRESLENMKERFEAEEESGDSYEANEVEMKNAESDDVKADVRPVLVEDGSRGTDVEGDAILGQSPSVADEGQHVQIEQNPPATSDPLPRASSPRPPSPPVAMADAIVIVNEVARTASEMPPPPPPPSVPPPPLPTVNVQPPTPQTSQEDVPTAPSPLLVVPTLSELEETVADESPEVPAGKSSQRRSSRSRSPVEVGSQRRSVRIQSRSPSPSPSSIPAKRPAESSEEPAAKRERKK
jgi:hypothetical protein